MSVVTHEAPAPAGPITSGKRSKVIDIVKGLAITLVTYGHTAQGLHNRGWWTGWKFLFSDAFVYSFHMPAFFFVAGLFVIHSLERRGARNFTEEKLKTILYPYFLWAVLFALLEPLMSPYRSAHHPFHAKAFLIGLIEGEQAWFLFTLFMCLMLALLTSKLPGWLRFLLAVALGMLTPLSVVFGVIAHEFCFVAAGMWVGSRIRVMDQINMGAAALGFAVLTVFQVAMIFHFGPTNRWDYILLGLTGTMLLFLLARLIDPTKIGDLFAWIGRASLGVYLVAAFVQGSVREILSRVFHTHELWTQLLIPTILSTIVPAWIWYEQERLHVGWLFHWPSRKKA